MLNLKRLALATVNWSAFIIQHSRESKRLFDIHWLYITAASPSVVLGLIARVEKSEQNTDLLLDATEKIECLRSVSRRQLKAQAMKNDENDKLRALLAEAGEVLGKYNYYDAYENMQNKIEAALK